MTEHIENPDFYNGLRQKLDSLGKIHGFADEPVDITARTLTAKEAIGEPEKKDYPLLKGKEVMIEAQFMGGKGEAYTCMPGNFRGTIKDILDLPLSNDLERACLIAGLNAVMNELGLVERTVHCRDHDPEVCAGKLAQYVAERFGSPRICFIGFQPAMINALSGSFPIRVVDLDENNIGLVKYGVLIQGPAETEASIKWADIILATGSTAVNATMEKFVGGKPVVFYGVTVAGIAEIYDYERFCPCSY